MTICNTSMVGLIALIAFGITATVEREAGASTESAASIPRGDESPGGSLSPVEFSGRVHRVEDSSGVDVKAADLNGDDFVDLVFTMFDRHMVAVCLGMADGRFANPSVHAVGRAPRAISIADFDGDGALDIVSANSSTNDVSVLMGDGDGAFAPEQRFSSGAGPRAITTADVDGDGIVDIVVPNRNSDTVSILLGLGDGNFTAAGELAAGVFPIAVAMADFNADGRTDMAVANQASGDVSILMNAGGATFGEDVRIELPRYGPQNLRAQPIAIVAAELSGDRNLDIATANLALGNVTIMRGDGEGSFAPPETVAVMRSPGSIAVSDLDSDGYNDLVAMAGDIEAGAVVLLAEPGGGFIEAQRFSADIGTLALTLTDVNRDGAQDIVTDLGRQFLGVGDGTFTVSERILAGDRQFLDIAAADVNQDGWTDLSVARLNVADDGIRGAVDVLVGSATGEFSASATVALPGIPSDVALADCTGDGTADLVVALPSLDAIAFARGRPGDGFDDVVVIELFSGGSAFSRATAIALADLNNDGRVDIAASNWVLLGDGDGTFTPVQNFILPGVPNLLAVGDLNGDGAEDLLIRVSHGNARRLIGRGDGTFEEAGLVSLNNSSPANIELADMNRDGRLDLITANRVTDEVTVALGLGNGSFGEMHESRGLGGDITIAFVAVSDLDCDGNPDVVTANEKGSVSFIRGHGDGTLAPPVEYTSGARLLSLSTLPIGQDPRPGIVALSRTSLSVLRRLGTAAPEDGARCAVTPTPEPIPPATTSPCAADCDGNRVVTISEIISCIRTALGKPSATCDQCDVNGDRLISIAELTQGVIATLAGCR